VLLLFGIALVLNANFASATNVTIDKTNPKVTAVNPANNSIVVSKKATKMPIKVTFNENIKSGTNWIVLTSNGKINPTSTSISGKTIKITPKYTLATNTKYYLTFHSNSVKDIYGNGVSSFTYSFTVSKLTKTEMKNGLSRVQSFYNKNNRLPTTVAFGSTKISITEFQKIIATQGMKVSTHKSSALSQSNIKTVSAYGRNSCGGWYKTGGTWLDYCPFCHSINCLKYNPKHTYEGEWTCSKCDADFCNCGRCKAGGSSVHLTKA